MGNTDKWWDDRVKGPLATTEGAEQIPRFFQGKSGGPMVSVTNQPLGTGRNCKQNSIMIGPKKTIRWDAKSPLPRSMEGRLGGNMSQGEGRTTVTSNRTLPQNSRTPRPTNLVERGVQKEQPEGNCGWGDARPTTTLGESMDHTCSKHGRATVIEAVRSQVASVENGPNGETSETGQGWTTVSRSARQATQRKEISQRANRTPIRPRLQELRGTMGSMGPAVVCWTDIQESRGTFWKRVQRSCNNGRLMDHLVKITRTEQKPRLARFTIYTHTGYGVALLQHMRRLQHKWGWYVREHRADRTFDTRVKRVQGKNATDKDGLHDGGENSTGEQISKWCKVGTLNINGALNKKYELQFLLEKSRIDCLALQETGIRETDWNLNVAGYHSFSVCGERRASKRGVSILLKKTMSGYVVGTSSPWHLFIRCFGNGLECPWILGCVYLPSGKAAEEPIKLVTEELAKLRKAFPIDPVAIMGDWNRTVNKVETLVKRVDHDFAVLRSAGLKATRAASNRAIDHIAVRMGKAGKSRSTQVLTSIDISDHYPVVCKILSKREKRGSGAPRAGRGEPGPSSGGDMSNGGRQGRRIATSQIPIPGTRDYEQKGARGRESHNRVVNSNYWQPLADLASTDITNMDADECQHFGDVAADTLTHIIHKVAADTEMSVGTKPPRVGRNGLFQSRVGAEVRCVCVLFFFFFSFVSPPTRIPFCQCYSSVPFMPIVEGGEETYRFMVNLKMSMPAKYDWILPVPGFWHILLHSAKALLQRCYPAGIQTICKASGADDKHGGVLNQERSALAPMRFAMLCSLGFEISPRTTQRSGSGRYLHWTTCHRTSQCALGYGAETTYSASLDCGNSPPSSWEPAKIVISG